MIKSDGLKKSFDKLSVLDGLSCEIKDGSVYGLIGANGAGKSTFLRLLSGCYYPDGGEITVNGSKVFDNPEIKKDIIFIPDDFFIPSGFGLKELSGMYASFYPEFDMKGFKEECDKIKLPFNRKISTFSKGMRRQSIMLCAIFSGCKYILFDETFDGLDPVIRNHMKNLLYSLVAEKGTTVVMTSHNLRELEDICDHLGVLYKGGILFEGDVTNIKSNVYKVQIAFKGDIPEDTFNGLQVLSRKQSGSVATLIIKGDAEKDKAYLESKEPVILDILPLTLEEVFIYEMEVLGYAFENIIL